MFSRKRKGKKSSELTLPNEDMTNSDSASRSPTERELRWHTASYQELEIGCSTSNQSEASMSRVDISQVHISVFSNDYRHCCLDSEGRAVGEGSVQEFEEEGNGWQPLRKIETLHLGGGSASGSFASRSAAGLAGIARAFIQRSSSNHSPMSQGSPSSSRHFTRRRSLSLHSELHQSPSTSSLTSMLPHSVSHPSQSNESFAPSMLSRTSQETQVTAYNGIPQDSGRQHPGRSCNHAEQLLQDTLPMSSLQAIQVTDPAVMGYFEMAEILLNSEEVEEECMQQQYAAAHHMEQDQQRQQAWGADHGTGHPMLFQPALYITPMQAVDLVRQQELISPASSFLPPQSSLSTSEWSLCTKSLARTHSAATRNGVPAVTSRESIQLTDFPGLPAGYDDSSFAGGGTVFSPLGLSAPQSLFAPSPASAFSPHDLQARARTMMNPRSPEVQPGAAPDTALQSYSGSTMTVTDPEVESYFLQKEMALASDAPLVLKTQHCGPLQVLQVADPDVMQHFLSQESGALMAEELSVTGRMTTFRTHL